MAELLMLVPTRGRPRAALALAQAWSETATGGAALLFLVDDDDPELPGYGALGALGPTVHVGPRLRLGPTLHKASAEFASRYPMVGFMGDDHRPRTLGWDRAYVDALTEMGTGIVYGDDLFQGERIPTQVAMTSDIVEAMGGMVPGGLVHMYIDDLWKAVGERLGCLRYLPDVVVEHLHPVAGKAEWDARYAEVNAPEVYAADQARFEAWLASGDLYGIADRLGRG
jgi:hypothetical protein